MLFMRLHGYVLDARQRNCESLQCFVRNRRRKLGLESAEGVMNRRPATPASRLIDAGMPQLYALDLSDLPDANATDPADLASNCGCIRIDVERGYNLGHTLAEAAAKLKSRHGHAIAPSTLAGWIDEHRELASYARLRDAGRRLAPPAQTIRTAKLYHRQVYEYAYHRPKLALLAESAEHARFTGGLASFLEAVPKTCPDRHRAYPGEQ